MMPMTMPMTMSMIMLLFIAPQVLCQRLVTGYLPVTVDEHRMWYSAEKANFFGARNACVRMGGALFIPTNKLEFGLVELVTGYDYTLETSCWIGAVKKIHNIVDPDTGNVIDYARDKFMAGEPSNMSGEYCVEAQALLRDNILNDVDCIERKNVFMCSIPINK